MKFIFELLCSDAKKHYNSKALPTLVHTKFVFLFYYDLHVCVRTFCPLTFTL